MIASALLVLGAARLAAGAEIVGHRGASHDAPENTLTSVKLGWEQQADAVEVDVHLTADGRIVCMHDPSTKRIGAVDRLIREQTLPELQRLDVGEWKDTKFAGERIPLLADVLATIPSGKRLFIEIKCGPEVLPELQRELKAAGKRPGQTAIIAFDREVVRQAKKLMPQLQVYWLASLKPDKETGEVPKFPDLIRLAREAGVDGLNVSTSDVIDRNAVEQVHRAGLRFLVWTVNEADVARRLVDAGVDGITTDRPQWLRQQLAGGGASE